MTERPTLVFVALTGDGVAVDLLCPDCVPRAVADCGGKVLAECIVEIHEACAYCGRSGADVLRDGAGG